MDMLFVGDFIFLDDKTIIDGVDFVVTGENLEKIGEDAIRNGNHDSYLIPKQYPKFVECTDGKYWYCKDQAGDYVIFDNHLQLVCGFDIVSFDVMMNAYPLATPMKNQDKYKFDWAKYYEIGC